jgi:dephospho-CoA kinase
MTVVGLTGSIATGKSAVAGWLSKHGILVIDADRVAREVVLPGTDGYLAVKARFPEVMSEDGIDRAALRRLIVRDPTAKRDLEAITHPRILASVARRLDQARAERVPFAVVEAALMVETGSYRRYDALLVVTCRPDIQLERLMMRDHAAEDEALRIIAAQLPLSEKEKVATEIIRNDGDLSDLERETARAWDAIRARFSS